MSEAELHAKVVAQVVNQPLFAIDCQGNVVRDLKAAKADKAAVDAGVAALKALKDEFKKVTGREFVAAPAGLSV